MHQPIHSTIEEASVRFAMRQLDECEAIADRVLEELANVSGMTEGKPLTWEESKLLCDLESKADAAERKFQHAFDKLRWEISRRG